MALKAPVYGRTYAAQVAADTGQCWRAMRQYVIWGVQIPLLNPDKLPLPYAWFTNDELVLD